MNNSNKQHNQIQLRLEKVKDLLLKADRHYRQGHRFRAIWNYNKVLRLHPENVPALVNLGLIYSTTKGKGSLAMDLLKRALHLDPENPTILFNLGTLTAHTGDLDEAMKLFRRSEQIRPNYPDLHYNIAYLCTQMNDWESAEKEVEIELQNSPGNFNARVMKEALLNRKGQDQITQVEPATEDHPID